MKLFRNFIRFGDAMCPSDPQKMGEGERVSKIITSKKVTNYEIARRAFINFLVLQEI